MTPQNNSMTQQNISMTQYDCLQKVLEIAYFLFLSNKRKQSSKSVL